MFDSKLNFKLDFHSLHTLQINSRKSSGGDGARAERKREINSKVNLNKRHL